MITTYNTLTDALAVLSDGNFEPGEKYPIPKKNGKKGKEEREDF